jgi:hypothetical protein
MLIDMDNEKIMDCALRCSKNKSQYGRRIEGFDMFSESPFRFEHSKKELEVLQRLESDTIKEGEGKILKIKMGFRKEGKCIIFKNKKRVSLILIDNDMETKVKTYTL